MDDYGRTCVRPNVRDSLCTVLLTKCRSDSLNFFPSFFRVQEMQTIAICEMKEEDTTVQIMFWEMMNEVLLNNGHPPDTLQQTFADSWLMRLQLIGEKFE